MVDVAPTPNPLAMKFTVSGIVAPKAQNYPSAEAAAASPIASRIFALGGVANVFLVNDFVTVNRAPQADWTVLVPRIRTVLDEVLP